MKPSRALWLLLLPLSSQARPEYATREKFNCTQCHVSPWGSGPRTVFGKSYGTRGIPGGKTTNSDLFYGDLRLISYYSLDHTSQRTSGVALMEAAASTNIPVTESSEGSEMRALVTYNMAPLSGASVREAYLRFRSGPEAPDASYWLVGRFVSPFGLFTDEHRTYTRIQTGSTINRFNVGAAWGAQLSQELHLDLALVNDFQTGGALNTRDLTWGSVFNLRWNPVSAPLLFGTSLSYERFLLRNSPFAASFYSVLSLDRLTHDSLSGSLQGEFVLANHWNDPSINATQINPSLGTFFIAPGGASYFASVREATSLGAYILAKYNLNRRLSAIYKLDFLALDASRSDTRFIRNGIGFESYLNSNLILNARYELAAAPPSATAGSTLATPLGEQSDLFLFLRLWI